MDCWKVTEGSRPVTLEIAYKLVLLWLQTLTYLREGYS